MGTSHIEPMLRNNVGGAEWDQVRLSSANGTTPGDRLSLAVQTLTSLSPDSS